LTIGILLIVLAGPQRLEIVNPGPLTFQHSGFESCASCHTTSGKGPLNWLHSAFAGSSEMADSRQCKACHDLGAQGMAPHSLALRTLQTLSAASAKPTSGKMPWTLLISDAITDKKHGQTGQLPCMACHQEHRGQSANLSAVSNLRCVSCHQARFDSLSVGHPAFRNYPFSRRSRINFDHTRHFNKHFREVALRAKAPAGCNSCHRPDIKGRTMLIKGFETTCAGCHAEQIEGAGRASTKGIVVYGVPGLDVPSLIDANASIGAWPFDAEDELTPFMVFLLSADPEFLKARQQLGDLDLLELADAEPEQLKAVEAYAWSIKRLFAQLAAEGIPALKMRLQAGIGRDISMSGISKLSGILSVDAFRAAAKAWFPGLHKEFARHRAGEDVPIPEEADSAESEGPADMAGGEDWSAAGGWYREEFSLYYRPTGHQDEMVAEWLNITQSPKPGIDAAAANAVFELLADPRAPGRCTKCHSVETVDNGHRVQWTGARPNMHKNAFTVFSHTAHLSLLGKEGCLSCHALDDDADFAAGFKDRDPNSFTSNFRSIERKTCAGCHTAAKAGDSCVTCHDYHIGNFPPAMTRVPKVMTKMRTGG
jgi:hypothetical protein